MWNNHKYTQGFMQNACYFCQILRELQYARQVFEKKCKYQMSRKSVQLEPSWSMWTEGRTDRQTDTAKLNVVFHNLGRTRIPSVLLLLHIKIRYGPRILQNPCWGGSGRFESVRFWYTNSLMRRSDKIRNTNHDVMITVHS